MYFYESHMGGIYYNEENLDYDFLYCEQCGDSDWLIGYAANKDEARDLLIDDDMDDDYKKYIEEIIDEAFDEDD